MLTKEEGKALVAVLSLAENHPMWTDPLRNAPSLKDFADEQYAAITEVRAFLKRNGVMTLHEALQQQAKRTFDRIAKEEEGGKF
jgi:hypothetical protein